MRKLLVLVWVICFGGHVAAQQLQTEDTRQYNEFLSGLRQDPTLEITGNIKLLDKIDTAWWNDIMQSTESDERLSRPLMLYERIRVDTNLYSFADKVEYRKGDSVFLSAADMDTIRDGLRLTNGFTWRTAAPDLCTVVMQQYLDSLSMTGTVFEKVYAFSQPVFLHHDTVCVFYYHYLCGELCGGGQMNIYLKTNAGWRVVKNLYNWMN